MHTEEKRGQNQAKESGEVEREISVFFLEFHFFLRIASEAFAYEFVSSNFFVFPDHKRVLSARGTIRYNEVGIAH
jgi:hypothetical protein